MHHAAGCFHTQLKKKQTVLMVGQGEMQWLLFTGHVKKKDENHN